MNKELTALFKKKVKNYSKEIIYHKIYRLLLVGNSSSKREKLKILRGIVKKLEKEWSVKHESV